MSCPQFEFVVAGEGRQFSRRAVRCKARRRPRSKIVLPGVAEPVGEPNRIGRSVAARHRLLRPFPQRLLESERRPLRQHLVGGLDRSIETAGCPDPGEFAAVSPRQAARHGRIATERARGLISSLQRR